MTVHLPTLKQLQYLVALRRHGHFGRAAEACFVTQSTLSAGHPRARDACSARCWSSGPSAWCASPRSASRIADKAQRVLRESEELADLARAEGQPLTGELRMGVIPTIAPFLLPAMLPRLRAQWPELKLYPARGDQPGGLRPRSTAASSIACCSLCPSPAATSTARTCSTTACSSPFPPARRPTRATVAAESDRRGAAAAARGRPLPEGPCAVRLQPARAARRRGDARHLAPHVGADGRQRARPDLRPANGDRRRDPRRHRRRRAAARLRRQAAAGSPWSGAGRARARRSSGCSPTASRDRRELLAGELFSPCA